MIFELISRGLAGSVGQNKIEYISNLETAENYISEQQQLNVLVTGSRFSDDLNKVDFSGMELAKYMRKYHPDSLILRYSSLKPEEALQRPEDWGINGEIPKIPKNLDALCGLLKDQYLRRDIDRKEWEALKQRHLDIMFYDNLPGSILLN